MNKLQFSKRELWLHLLFWFCVFILPVYMYFSDDREMRNEMLFRWIAHPVVFYANYFILVPIFLLHKRIKEYVVWSLLLLIVVNVGLNLIHFGSPMIKPPAEFQNMYRDMPRPKFESFRFVFPAAVSFAFFILGGVIPLLKDFYQREKRTELKEAERKESELQFLKAQLNPHFIFNALNSVYSLVRSKSNDAPEAVLAISEMMRYMLYEANKEWVPLSREIEYIQNYISLQRLRYNNSSPISFNIVGDYQSKKIEPLLLIPFLENSFKYGTDYQGNTDIRVQMEVSSDGMTFVCSNQMGFVRNDIDKKASGIGLVNVKNRLELLYPNMHELTFGQIDDRYLVTLKLKWK